jgi:uncharacterized protein YdeI (YjbR/CyaY-like superfamily)
MATTKRSRTGSATNKKDIPADRIAPQNEREPILAPSSATQWEAWLRANHASSKGVLLRIPKKKSSESTLTYAAALDAALCWGWIDSQKRALDETAWLQRITPRTSKSPWSKINRSKAEALIASGRMQPPGLAEVERAKRDGRWARAYDSVKTATVPDDLAEAFERNRGARLFFETLDAANRYAILYRVTTAKRPETRARRIAKFVAMCAAHETLHPVRAKGARATPRSRKPTTRAR